jgi:hypothetical protein
MANKKKFANIGRKKICRENFILEIIYFLFHSKRKVNYVDNKSYNIESIGAIKVVVKPWYGRHNTYGIFLLQNNYKPERLIVFNSIEAGKASRCWDKNLASQTEIAGISIQSGYYPVRVYMKTRIALLLIIWGYKNQLEQPLNWQLTYQDRRKKIN